MTLELEMRAGGRELTLSNILTDPSLLPEEGSPDRHFLDAFFAARREYTPKNRKVMFELGENYAVKDPDIFCRLKEQIGMIIKATPVSIKVSPEESREEYDDLKTHQDGN